MMRVDAYTHFFPQKFFDKLNEWARAEGIDIKERGRVPAEVIEKYKAARA